MTMLSIMILISAHIRAVHYPSPRIHLPSHIRFSTCRLISSSSSSAAAAAHTHTHIHREGCGGILHFKMAAIPPSTSSLLATCDRKARRIIHDLRASLSSLESISSSSTSSSDPSVASEHDQHLQTLRNGLADLASIGAEMDSLLSARTGRGREPENVLELWRRKRAGLNDEMESVRIALVNIERREVRTFASLNSLGSLSLSLSLFVSF